MDSADVDIERIAGDWLGLGRRWEKVVGSGSTLGSRSGGWYVRKEYNGDPLKAPIEGANEVAVYLELRRNRLIEVGRWNLSDLEATERDSDG